MTKPDQFKQEFLALLSKYKATMTVREISHSWNTYVEGVNFEFAGEVIDDEYVVYYDIQFGVYTEGE